jgi:hypothetical protein
METSPPPNKPARKRGAQPGNRNAYKHGFYARPFSKLEIDNLASLQNGLADEIAMLRLLMRRVMEQADQQENSMEDWLQTLQRLSLVANRLARLLKTHRELTGELDTEQEEVFQAFHDMMTSRVVKPFHRR